MQTIVLELQAEELEKLQAIAAERGLGLEEMARCIFYSGLHLRHRALVIDEAWTERFQNLALAAKYGK